ncbi:GyrI-like domain-containing protein [Anaerococcus murdochii]
MLEEFFPENGYKHSGLPDFEVYTENDIHDPNYEMELWVPIVKQ